MVCSFFFLLACIFGSIAQIQPAYIEPPQIIDLTHPFDNGYTIQWPAFEPFNFTIKMRGHLPNGLYLEANEFSQPEHCGTHCDAPSHFANGYLRIGQIPIEKLIGPGVVIDIEERASKNPDTTLHVSDIEAWEFKHGQIPDGAVVIMKSGFGRYYENKTAYLGWPAGTEETNPKDITHLHFPGFGHDAAQWLVDNRNIIGVAVDVVSIDAGQSKDFKAHLVFAHANIWGVENLNNADLLPPKGFTIYNMVYLLRHGSGAPTRIFAIMDEEKPVTDVAPLLQMNPIWISTLMLLVFMM